MTSKTGQFKVSPAGGSAAVGSISAVKEHKRDADDADTLFEDSDSDVDVDNSGNYMVVRFRKHICFDTAVPFLAFISPSHTIRTHTR